MEIKRYIDFINESSKYKNINSKNFIKLFNKIINHYKEKDSSLINDFKHKLFDYVSQDQSKKFPINFFSTEYKKLIDVIHILDNKNAEIFLLKNRKSVMGVSLPDLKPVWKDEERKIYVYHAKTMFEAITLGRGTNFCVSADYKNGTNYFNEYVYQAPEFNWSCKMQISSMYFVKSFSQKQEYQTLCIDARKDGTFLYTDVRNMDREYEKYNLMLKDDYTSPDLKIIPKQTFKFILTTPTKEEIEIDFSKNRSLGLLLIKRDRYNVIQLLEELKEKRDSYQTEKDYYCEFVQLLWESNRKDIHIIMSSILEKKKEYIIPIMQISGIMTGTCADRAAGRFLTDTLEKRRKSLPIFEKIFMKMKREYKIFFIIDIIMAVTRQKPTSTWGLPRYFKSSDLINLKEETYSRYGTYYKYISYYDFLIKSVENIKMEELNDVIEKYLKMSESFFYYSPESDLLLFKELMGKYDKKVLNLIYYKENYDKKYKK